MSFINQLKNFVFDDYYLCLLLENIMVFLFKKKDIEEINIEEFKIFLQNNKEDNLFD